MIQKLEQRVIGTDYGCGGASFSEVIDKVNEVIDYINSRPEEIPPYCKGVNGHPAPPGVSDLERAAEEYASKTLCDPDDGPSTGLAKESFIAGAEWQEKQDLKWAGEIHKNGYNLCKEQMMKDSEEDALLLERAWLTLDGFGHEELAERLRQFAERKGLIWK